MTLQDLAYAAGAAIEPDEVRAAGTSAHQEVALVEQHAVGSNMSSQVPSSIRGYANTSSTDCE